MKFGWERNGEGNTLVHVPDGEGDEEAGDALSEHALGLLERNGLLVLHLLGTQKKDVDDPDCGESHEETEADLVDGSGDQKEAGASNRGRLTQHGKTGVRREGKEAGEGHEGVEADQSERERREVSDRIVAEGGLRTNRGV